MTSDHVLPFCLSCRCRWMHVESLSSRRNLHEQFQELCLPATNECEAFVCVTGQKRMSPIPLWRGSHVYKYPWKLPVPWTKYGSIVLLRVVCQVVNCFPFPPFPFIKYGSIGLLRVVCQAVNWFPFPSFAFTKYGSTGLLRVVCQAVNWFPFPPFPFFNNSTKMYFFPVRKSIFRFHTWMSLFG